MCESGSPDTVDQTLAVLRRAAQRLGELTQDLSEEELAGSLIALRHAIDLQELAHARMAAELAATDYPENDGSASAEAWIRHRCRTTYSVAVTALTAGEQLPRLPRSVAALEQGEIGFAHLGLIARTTAAIQRTHGDVAADEAPLLDLARVHSVGRFRKDCESLRHALDAQGALRDQQDAVAHRRLETSIGENGMYFYQAVLDPLGGATVRTALEALGRRNGAGDDRHKDRRWADALIELAGHAMDEGALPQRGSVRPHLQVTATLESLMGLTGAPAAELQFGTTLCRETLQRLGCDSNYVSMFLSAEKQVVDVGRARRTPPPATMRAVRVRDRGCVWPGCDRAVAWTTAHHVLFWGGGHEGKTEVPNLVCLCYRHHEMVHEGGWQLYRTDEGVSVVPPVQPFVGRWQGVVPPGSRLRDDPELAQLADSFNGPVRPKPPPG